MATELTNQFNKIEGIINRSLRNPYINTTIKVLLGLYAAMAAPKLSKTAAKLMDNIFVRVGFAFLIVYMASKDVTISLLIAVGFIIALQTANKHKLYDSSLSSSSAGSSTWLPSQKTVITDESVSESPSDLPQQNLVNVVNDVNLQGLSKDEVQAMRNAEPSHNLEQFVEEIEGGNVPILVKTAFTTSQNLNNAQIDFVPGSNSDSCVTSFENQHCIQGLQNNQPNGYNDSIPVSNF